MNESFRSMLEGFGMPKETSDDDVTKWAGENLQKISQRSAVEAPPATATPAVPVVTTSTAQPPVAELTKELSAEQLAELEAKKKKELDEATQRAATFERDRGITIRGLVSMAGVDGAIGDALIREGADLPTAARRIQDEQAKRREPAGIRPAGSERESFRAAVLDGFAMRLNWRPSASDKIAQGANEFRSMRFLDLCRKSLETEGISTRRLTDRDLISRAFAEPFSMRASDGQAWHTTGNFANLLLDASNKVLLKAFTETRVTWNRWARNAGTTPDLKAINRIRLGEVGNLPMVPENDDYKDLAMSDSKESYKPDKHGAIISLTWETMINDDLNAFSRLVQLQGNAAARTVDRGVYQLLFNNPTMSDTGALFNSTAITTAGGHNNLVSSDLSVAVLDAAYEDMMLQPGINSDVTLGLMPRFLLVAPGISGTAWQLVNSIADPAAGGTNTGNANTANIYGPSGPRRLEVIEVHWLAGNDADSWYLACDNNEIDTVEVTFLEGEETPAFEQESAFRQDAVLYKVRQTFGVAAIDWRGLYKSNGSG